MNQHPDDLAVDKFAAAMKEKLALARSKGRDGWEQCDPIELSAMLHEHVAKGDPRDVANFCMFLWNLEKPITPCAPALAKSWEPDEEACKFLADMITADPDQITRVGFHLGYAKDDEGNLVHGFSVYEADYPEEGVHTLVETNPAPAVAVNEQTLSELKNMVRAYVRLLEAGKDRIESLGGDCDPVDRMEESDSNLRTAKAAIAAAEAAKGGV